MKLGQWKDTLAPGELARVAEANGIRLATFYECINGKKGDDGQKHPIVPTVAVARRLSVATGGLVSVAEILGIEEGAPEGVDPAHDTVRSHVDATKAAS